MDKTAVLIYKTIGLMIRAIPILIFYLKEDFYALGNYSLFSSIAVFISGIIGFEFHMISSRDLANTKTINMKSPLSQHISMIVLLTIPINVILFLFHENLIAGALNLVVIFYSLGEHVRFLNFTNKIVASSKMNLTRDLLFCFPFVFVYKIEYFLLASWVALFVAILISIRYLNIHKFSPTDWSKEFRYYISRSYVFLLNVVSRNLLAYSDRFFVFLSSGTEMLGKYAIISYINSSLLTIIDGSVVYVRIPELISNKIDKNVFLKQVLVRSIPMIAFFWIVLYIFAISITLNDIEMSGEIILAFIILGICSMFLSSTGQIIYSSERDKFFVITNVIFTLLVLTVGIIAFNTVSYLLMIALCALLIGFWRIAYENSLFRNGS